ncbi:Ig-like domain-containing protein [Nocardioides stalactiti]|uniref:Ig-like domain-containing protein n=1 Tax=Nocardioides stalactiti TaxID=2755356 RepID=UPI001C800AC1|nr:Ig-like domain-containing protein [Nocardioides stalactiti]
MARRPLKLMMALGAVMVVALFGMPSFSSATFTATTQNATSTVAAAFDWTAPVVSVNDPGSVIKDTVTITANATDARSGINNVVVQYLAPNAVTWTTLCTDTTSPYTCSWNTKLVADGSYSLRAIATDNAGYTTTSDPVTTQIANNLLVVLSDPGDIVKGNVSLTTTIYNAGLAVPSVKVEYALAGTTTWRTLGVCTALLLPPYPCTWNTTSATFTQGESYDLRAVATIGTTTTTSATVTEVMIDNTAPTVTMTDPGTPLRGTTTFAATATDADAGITTVALQYQRTGTTTWTTFCTLSAEPYSCRYDTNQLADATYAFRAIATDAINNTTTSTAITGRVVDNTVAAVAVEDPGAFLAGTVTVTASASSSSGIINVRIERAPVGTATWTTLCTDTTSPYTCTWDTTTVSDGLYDLRAVLTDPQNRVTTSTTLTNRRVDNSPLRGYDVQTANGGSTAFKLGTGDTLKLTYTDQVAPGSISTGWNGTTSLAVVLRLRDALLVGSSGNNDTIDVLKTAGGTALPLGSINLKQNYIKNNKTAQFNATLTAATTTVDGTTATVYTITIGTLASGGSVRAPGATSTMVWTPGAGALDLEGRACSTAPVSERGALDKEF